MRFFIPQRTIVNKKEWHDWLAWHPIKVDNYFVWCEHVWRKKVRTDYIITTYVWNYRLKSQAEPPSN